MLYLFDTCTQLPTEVANRRRWHAQTDFGGQQAADDFQKGDIIIPTLHVIGFAI